MTKLPQKLVIHHPCGVMQARPGWGRDRAASLALRDYELWFVWRGSGWMHDGRRTHDLRPGFCAWMRPGGVYDAGTSARDPLGFTYIHFVCGRAFDPPEFFEVEDLAFIDATTRRVVRDVDRRPRGLRGERVGVGVSTHALLRAVLLDLLSNAPDSPPGPYDRALDAIAAGMRSDPGDTPPVSRLAAGVGLTPAHFSRLFRTRFGRSPRDYRLAARIDRARDVLAESSLSIGQVADALGYADVFAFSKQFKRFTGQSPTAYRRGRG